MQTYQWDTNLINLCFFLDNSSHIDIRSVQKQINWLDKSSADCQYLARTSGMKKTASEIHQGSRKPTHIVLSLFCHSAIVLH